MTINLRTVEIGGLPLHNVEASVVHSLSAPLLFGQSAIQKLGPIKLDGDKLIIGKVSVLDTEQRKTKALDLNRRAYLADESGRSDEAIKLYNQANEIYPLANSYDGLSYIYSKLGKHEDAIKSSEQAVALEPSNDQYQYNYAVALYEGKRYDAAVQFFSTFYDNSIYKLSHKEAGGMPKEGIQSVVNACNYLGDIYYEKGMNQKAIEWLNKGIKLSRPIFGEDYYACLKLGDIAFNAAKYREAVNYYQIGVSEEPNRLSNLPRYYKMGKAYEYLEIKDSSSICFQNAMKIYKSNKSLTSKESSDPDGLRLYSYAMESYLEQARWQFNFARERNFDMLGKLACSFADSCYTFVIEEGYGIFNGKKGAFGENDFAKLLSISLNVGDTTSFKRSMFFLHELYPQNINFLYTLTILTSDNSKESLAKKIPMYKAILRVFPTFYMESRAEILNNLAWAQCSTGDYANAETNASQAVELDGEDPNKWETYGECFYYQGKYKQCIEAMSRSIDLTTNQNNPEKWLKGAYKLRGESYIKIGKKSKGDKDIEKSNLL